ncbi:hypothetical protein [Microcoleus sp. S13C4]|uniref:hypothetical protein n=1 Tax=Microcoleus sp. S13C4 TaxID=3055410 RepID=UPI002FD6C0E9
MMQRIKLMADFDCYPLWDMDDGGDIDPTDLPLREATIERLLNWQNIYDGIMDWDDPASAGFASKQEEIAFEREGISLWQKVQKELGDDYQVFYKSQLQQRVLTSVYKSGFSNYLQAVLTYELPQVIQKRRLNLADKGIPENQIIAQITVPVTRAKSSETQEKIRSVDGVQFNEYLYLYQASSTVHIVRANSPRRKFIPALATRKSDEKKD